MYLRHCTYVLIGICDIFKSNGYICLTWNFTGETLKLKCLTNQTRSKISFIDPLKQEQGYCAIPYPFPSCISLYRNGNIHQTLTGKETIFDLRGLADKTVNGQWSCHHGTNFETAFAVISVRNKIDKESPVYLRLTGPTLIRTREPVWLRCVSNIPMTSKSVRFYVNDKLYNTLTKRDSGCYSSVNYTCRPNDCQCSADGKSYLIKHEGFESGGIFLIECKVKFHTSLEMSDCMMIRVTESPVLELMSTAVCSQSTSIKLSCNASGEIPVLHFRLWQHSYNGNIVRYLKGERTANTSILNLDKCNYEDEGDYICSAWTRIENVDLSNNISSKMVIKGLPIVTDKYIYKEPLLTVTVKIYADPHPINVSWFIENVQIKNSTRYRLTLSKTLVERKLHGKLINKNGFSANLTLKTFVNARKTLLMIVQNEIGNVSEYFVIGEKGSVSDSEFHLKDILWFLSGTIILILIISVFANLFNSYRRGGRQTLYSESMFNTEEVTGHNVHQYDIPEIHSNYEAMESVQNEERASNQLNDHDEIDKEELHESEDGYEIVHDYMEVL